MKTEVISPYGVKIWCDKNEILNDPESIIALIEKHKILIFKNFEATPDDLVKILNTFGTPIRHAKWKRFALKTHPEIYVLHNDKTKGQLSPEIWHIDQSFLQLPPTFSFLYSITVAKTGGTTIFANQSQAYRNLPTELKRRVTGKVAAHKHAKNYAMAAVPTKEELEALGIADGHAYHPLIMPQISGENCIYSVYGHIQQILGLSKDASDELLDELRAHAIKDEYIYEHHWEEKDFLIWDNTSMLHSAKGTVDSVEDQYSRELWRMNCRNSNA
jgi:taurine dioxygenase